MNSEERKRVIRVGKANKGISFEDIALAIGSCRQNVGRIAAQGSPGPGCTVRAKLAEVAGVPCNVLWCADPGEQEEEEEGEGEEEETKEKEMADAPLKETELLRENNTEGKEENEQN